MAKDPTEEAPSPDGAFVAQLTKALEHARAFLQKATTEGPFMSKAQGCLRAIDEALSAAPPDTKIQDLLESVGIREATAEAGARKLLAEKNKLQTALLKISDIRDSIIGMQGFNFSEHAYPLVAALDEAGFPGKGYEISKKNFGTLIQQRNAAEQESERLREKLAKYEDNGRGKTENSPAHNIEMTPEQKEAQRRSFVYGNLHLHDPSITRELVDEVADEMAARKTTP